MRLSAAAPWLLPVAILALSGCGTRPLAQPQGHIATPEPPPVATIPAPVRSVPLPPPPAPREAEVRYSVVVTNQPVRDVLIAMARETRVNFDIHPGIEGSVNLNAIDQTLKQILTRMARQVDMRWESDGQTITVMPDTPYLRTYKVDYVNMSRDVAETVTIATQVISGVSAGGTGQGTSGTGSNNSTLTINSVARHRFWETLEKNIKDLLRETDKLMPEGSSETVVQARGQNATVTSGQARAAQRRTLGDTVPGVVSTAPPPVEAQGTSAQEFVEQRLTFREAASVIVNPESGVVTVRATSRQHEKVVEFLASVSGSSSRQVVIEATVVEVTLDDNYQAGVDWSALGLQGLGYSFRANFLGENLAQAPFFSLSYSNPNAAAGGSISSTVKLLEKFGRTRVLSSPKLMVLNNQTAVLKVVDNKVYFTIKADTVTNQSTSTTTFTTTQNVVPVGFIMNVTPQISEGDQVTLNVRPTVTRIIGFVKDPNPSLAVARVESLIPETQAREMESVLKVGSGQTAILGGLMIDSFVGSTDGLPLAARIPLIGDLVSYRNDRATKSELVIFIRPFVVREASIDADLAHYRRFLPGTQFFRDTERPLTQEFEERVRAIERGDWPRAVEGTPVPVVPAPPAPERRP
jgi:general secretion pathway protein D